ELAAHPALELVERLPRLTGQRQHAPGVAEHRLAGGRGRGAAAQPVQELDAQLVLEGADVLGDRRLREEECLGGAREASELRHLREDLEATEVHQDGVESEEFVSGSRSRRRTTRRSAWRTAGTRRRP